MARCGYAGVGCAALICQCGVCGVNMPVWGVRRVYAGVPYSCTPVRVCNPCCSVTLYCVVSSTSSAGQDGDRRPTSATQAWASSNILSSQDKPQRGQGLSNNTVSKYCNCNHQPLPILLHFLSLRPSCSPCLSWYVCVCVCFVLITSVVYCCFPELFALQQGE